MAKVLSVELDAVEAGDLNAGRIPTKMREKLERLKRALPGDARVIVNKRAASEDSWLIVTGDERKPPFEIERDKKDQKEHAIARLLRRLRITGAKCPSAKSKYDVFDLVDDRKYDPSPLWTMTKPAAPVSAQRKLSLTLSESPTQVLAMTMETSMPAEPEVLLRLYSEICYSWRALTDVRFKLLTALPAISGIALVLLISKDASTTTDAKIARTIVGALGFVVSVWLYVYERRNSELYDDLISRARRIETELGISTGQFRGRLGTSGKKALGCLPLKHDLAINWIYGGVIVAWVLTSVAPWIPLLVDLSRMARRL